MPGKVDLLVWNVDGEIFKGSGSCKVQSRQILDVLLYWLKQGSLSHAVQCLMELTIEHLGSLYLIFKGIKIVLILTLF